MQFFMYLLLVFLPLIGSLCAGFFGRKLGPLGASYITVSCLMFTFFLSIVGFYEVSLLNCCVYVKLTPWINSEMLNVDWGFLFDSLTVIMCCVVTFVSSIVHLYSTEYMANDPHLSRFMSYLSLFTFFMLVLVTANNLTGIFIGWLFASLSCFLLFDFWFTRIQVKKTSIRNIISNLFSYFKNVNIYSALNPGDPLTPEQLQNLLKGANITKKLLDQNDAELLLKKIWILQNSHKLTYYSPKQVWASCLIEHKIQKYEIIMSHLVKIFPPT